MDGWMDGRTDGWMDKWIDGWMDKWVDGWKDGWMDGQVLHYSSLVLPLVLVKLTVGQ